MLQDSCSGTRQTTPCSRTSRQTTPCSGFYNNSKSNSLSCRSPRRISKMAPCLHETTRSDLKSKVSKSEHKLDYNAVSISKHGIDTEFPSQGFVDQDIPLIMSKQEASRANAYMDICMHRVRVYVCKRHGHASKQGATVLCYRTMQPRKHICGTGPCINGVRIHVYVTISCIAPDTSYKSKLDHHTSQRRRRVLQQRQRLFLLLLHHRRSRAARVTDH